jgi:putative selenate reductase
MEKAFRPAPLELLARWIFDELDHRDTVLGIPQGNFQIPGAQLSSQLFGRTLAVPLGMAAGPHTQLSQNIIAGWLCGARFIELKTVQILDEIAVSRPCIDSADETYNCEWSQELTLEQSFDEYLNAWVLVHALAHRLGLNHPGTLFAMSVGYNLEGIQNPRVQRFIASMRDARHALPKAVDAVAKTYPAVRDIEIPHQLSDHITLSTMHGCPPAEIERIARYLLTDLGVNTWVKLNPTLLGPERLRGILNHTLGFEIEVPDAAFEHDPKFEAAMAMVRNLAQVAEGLPQQFGLKLSNTLEVINKRPIFPGTEKMMYMSGRSLHPLTVTLAKLVTEELDGQVPISFCGGAEATNFADLVAAGLSPITVCTDLLKPGGYARLQQYLVNLEGAMTQVGADTLDAFVQLRSGGQGAHFSLARHAECVLGDERYSHRDRPLHFKGARALGTFDCIAAPCQEACPAHQNIPDYLWLVAHGRPAEAMEVILHTNPLPGVTGSICDHPCTERCVRNFYDAPLGIREIKRFAFENCGRSPQFSEQAKETNGVKVAIVGAGPAGMSAAYFLAKMGFEAEIFEGKTHLGGMVGGAVPRYRLDDDALAVDLERLRQLGVKIHLGQVLGGNLALSTLRQDFNYLFLGVGAQRGKRLGIEGETALGVIDALEFLDKVRAQKPMELGRRILVIGGGNSAMDAARSARRLAPEAQVSLVYRRTRSEMPADPEEVQDCLLEGIELKDLLAPARVVVEGGRVVGLACTRMRLGEPDASGRPRPVPADGPEEVLPAGTIVSAIGQEAVLDFLGDLELKRHRDGTLAVAPATCETSQPGIFAGGDVARGPASVIKAIADGRSAAEEIGRRHGVILETEPSLAKTSSIAEMLAKKGPRALPQTVPVLPISERGGFQEVLQGFSHGDALAEASRCLDCDELCSLCVTVCPNRANRAFAMAPLALEWPVLVARGGQLVEEGPKVFSVQQSVQILNIGDYCNECGNCVTFCPTSGAPFRDKPRFWLDAEGFENAQGDAFRLELTEEGVTLEARLGGSLHRLERRAEGTEYHSDVLRARFATDTWRLLDWEPVGPLDDGQRFDLAPCVTLIALLGAEQAIPTHFLRAMSSATRTEPT